MPAPWPAPAKLNLFLHILGRRADGYHELQTVFQLLDHGDWVWLSPRRDGELRLGSEVPGVPVERNLAWLAARRLQAHTGCRSGADIKLEKRLPSGGGLGGGSSDAATTLVGLNALWGVGCSVDELAALGAAIGADVPVFVRGRAAWAEGIGERLIPVDLAESWFVVIAPPCTVSTAEIFAAPELTRNSPPITIADFVSGGGRNDCEPTVMRRYPQVAQALAWLRQYGPAHMTGTGACVFASFATQAQAQAVWSGKPGTWQGFVARGVSRSPLLERLALAG